MENAALTDIAGVSMLVQSTQWPGQTPIENEVTPLRVIIENNSDQPLRIVYGKFALIAPQGVISSALPLHEIDATVEEPQTDGLAARPAVPRVTTPGFIHRGFGVAPYLSGYYPGIRPSASPFHHDTYYYGNHIVHWETTELPTMEMIESALPEGVLDSGGRLEGWLFFEEVGDADQVVFRADLVNAGTGHEFGEIRIPFDVN